MKLGSFEFLERVSWGVVENDVVIDAGVLLGERWPDLRSVIANRAYEEVERALRRAPRYPIEKIRWLPVVPNPDKIFCIGLNYEEHRKETGRPEVRHPTVFARYANSQAGHLCEVPLPRVSEQLDYEGELAVIIGRTGRYIAREEALSHVAGYACYNDVSVRDWQHHTHQFTPGKNFPGTGAFGPWMVTPDELGEFDSLRIETRVNGEVVQSALLGQMIFDIADLIAYCSSFTQLEPGDVIVTGTPGGVGAKCQPPRWLKPGDVAEVQIERVGLLRNRIVSERQALSALAPAPIS